jgi:imidazolonepropionase-like amidohydrolase
VNQPLLIKGANVITVAEAGMLSNADVRVVDGKIAEIGRNLAAGGAMTIPAAGQFVMPGLIDSHVHLKSLSQLPLSIAYGITTLRNMSGSPETLEWKKKTASGEVVGPEIITTGPITDGQMFWPGFRIVLTEEDAIKAVEDDIRLGYDYVKTYPDIPREAFIKLMQTANELGIKVSGHGSNKVSAQELGDLGYYSLEHVSRLPPDNDDDVVSLAKSGMWYLPTLTALRNVTRYIARELEIEDFEYTDLVPKEVVEDWYGSVKVYRADKRFLTFKMDNFAHLTKLFREHSDRVVAGTDIGIPGTLAGLYSHYEFELLVTVGGMSNMESLVAGTIRAAKMLGKEHEIGSIEVGKRADLIILDANPLDSITNTKRLGGVVKSGRYFDKKKLESLIDEGREIVRTENA